MAVEGLASRPPRARLLVPVLVVLGTLLIQAAWSLALPPFRGTDEFDHAFRAAAVAQGQWVSHWGEASHGRGVLVRAPRTLVVAASPVCHSYEYTGPDNCFPVKSLGHGDVEVASAATSYNPLFYWVVGTVARPFDGATALYVMRLTADLLCALMLGLAAWVTSLWARSWWPLLAAGFAFTPVAWFSVSIVAPNGLEICAGLTLWLALLGLATPRGRASSPTLLVGATVAAMTLTLLRPLGPAWLAMTVVAALATVGIRPSLSLLRRHGRLTVVCASAVALAGAGLLAWTAADGAIPLGGNTEPLDPLTTTLGQVPLWFLQGIAAFPRRGDAAPLAVYAWDGFALVGFLVAGFVVARRRLRLVFSGTFAAAVGVPVVLSLCTVSSAGAIWQGRYGLPFHVGVALLAGLALERWATRPREASSERPGTPALVPPPVIAGLAVLGCFALFTSNAVAVVSVFVRERATSPLSGSPSWVTAPPWLLVVLLGVAFASFAAAATRRGDVSNVDLPHSAGPRTREVSDTVSA